MKRFLILLFLFSGINQIGFGQVAAEPQPFPLTEYKITFSEAQMNAETIEITRMDGSKISGAQPKLIPNDDKNSITIDFTDCKEGKYLISGRRNDLELEYSVDR